MKTYDICLSIDGKVDKQGFSLPIEDAVDKVFDTLLLRPPFVNDYIGGTICVVCNKTDEVIWVKEITEKPILYDNY